MTRFWLVRHGSYGMIGRGLGGRDPHELDRTGCEEATRIAERLGGRPIRAVLASPVRRAQRTAEPLADRLRLPVGIEPDFGEVDFGSWSGLRFTELEPQPAWRAWNVFRSTAPVPDGETMLEVQSRVVAGLRRLSRRWPDDELAVVSHGDVIKAALVHLLGAPLDLMHRIEIAPASISQVELHLEGARILGVNLPP